MKKNAIKLTITNEDRLKLESLCEDMNVSPKRGKSYIISKLIQKSSVEANGIYTKPIPPKDLILSARENYANLSRIGSNLNQFVHLLQIKKIQLELGEISEIDVNIPFLLSLLKELNRNVQENKTSIALLTKRYS